MDFNLVKVILMGITLIASAFLLRRYRHFPSLSMTLLCFIIFQVFVREWYDFLFLGGVAFVLAGMNLEYIKLYKQLQDKKEGK